uniref:TonB-dependent receptor plug domain-containing protein n=1 Tax=candidate division WOR-3 bacterium TaxID=2052148 RepID=A0A7C4YIP2_UNCW3
MIFLVFYFQEFTIEGITIEGKIKSFFSYDLIDTNYLEFFTETKDIFQYLTDLNLIYYGSPLQLTQLSINSNSSKNLSFNLNGIPLNDPKTGIFDISLIPIETIHMIEIFKGGFSQNLQNSIDGCVNMIKEFKNIINLGLRNTSYNISFSRKFKESGLSIFSRYYDNPRKNSDGYIINLSFKYKDIFIDWTKKKTGLPGPVPYNNIPQFGDSDVYSLYDNENDYLFLSSYNFNRKDLNITPYIIYSKMIPYQKYINFFTGDTIDEMDDYRVYTIGLKTSFEKFLFFNIRIDSIDMKGIDTILGKKNFSININSDYQRFFWNFILNTGFGFDYDIISNLNWNGYFGIALKEPYNIYLMITRNIRKPSFNELYWPYYSNPELKTEKSVGITSGIKKENLEFMIYKKWINEKIGLNENWKPENIEKAEIYGASLKTSYNLENFTFYSIFKLMEGNEFLIDTIIELQYTPKYSFSLNTSLFKNPEIFFSFIYNDRIKKYRFNDLPSYFIINAGIKKDFKNIKFILTLENLLNRKYKVFFGYLNNEYYPGENFRINLNVFMKI